MQASGGFIDSEAMEQVSIHASVKALIMKPQVMFDRYMSCQPSGPVSGDSGGALFQIVDGKMYLRGVAYASALKYGNICSLFV